MTTTAPVIAAVTTAIPTESNVSCCETHLPAMAAATAGTIPRARASRREKRRLLAAGAPGQRHGSRVRPHHDGAGAGDARCSPSVGRQQRRRYRYDRGACSDENR